MTPRVHPGPMLCYASLAMAEQSVHKWRKQRLVSLLATAQGAKTALIVTHNDPDPDAIGAAVGLAALLERRLRIEVAIACRGHVGRAENRAMVDELHIRLEPLCQLDVPRFDLVALVDAQPGAGNQPLGSLAPPAVVIDHHPLRPESSAVPFADVRPDNSSTSAIVTGYLRAARVRLSARVATALFYGIKTDTLGLARESREEDTLAYLYLQRYLDREALSRIESASVPPDYFRALDRALHETYSLDGLVIARLGTMSYPDMAAEMADFLRRLDGVRVIVAVGQYEGEVIVSVRSPESGIKLDELVQAVVRGDGSAGGHDHMAAGRVPAGLAGSPEATEEEMIRRFREALGLADLRPTPLLPRESDPE